METKQVLLVDAFADEPLSGLPIGVVPDDVSREQLRAIAGELGTTGAVTLRDGQPEFVARGGATGFVGGGVAGCLGLFERDKLDSGNYALSVVDDGSEREYPVELREDRSVRLELPAMTVEDATVPFDRLAPALDVEVPAMEDVGSDLPLGRVEGFDGTLLVPVTFLEHLSTAAPDAGTLADLLAETGVARAGVFTFDTLGRTADLHVRLFEPSSGGLELPASGVVAASCGRYLAHHGAFDGTKESLSIECGAFLDRPGTIVTSLEERPLVGGSALITLDGSLSVPDDDSDDILEA